MPGASSAIGLGEPSSPYSGRATGTANQNGVKSPMRRRAALRGLLGLRRVRHGGIGLTGLRLRTVRLRLAGLRTVRLLLGAGVAVTLARLRLATVRRLHGLRTRGAHQGSLERRDERRRDRTAA